LLLLMFNFLGVKEEKVISVTFFSPF